EVEGWFETSLAKLQSYAVEYAANNADIRPYGFITYPGANSSTNRTWINQCKNQKISNTGNYQTFSFFGLIFTFSVGITIIMTAFILEPLVSWLRRRDDGLANSGRELAYVAGGKFQLQRMVFE